MAIEQEPEIPADIPSWLMTFSDVITLLMTFFILLLTFATSEPETFEQMHVSVFGGGGATGIAGRRTTATDRDSLVVRQRPRSCRISLQGTETPPIHSDPAMESVSEGLAGLEEDEGRDLSTQHLIAIPLPVLIDSRQEITALGIQQLRMMAQQLLRQELDLEFLVASDEQLPSAIKMVGYLFENEGILPGRLAVGVDRTIADNSVIQILLTRPILSPTNGAQAKTR